MPITNVKATGEMPSEVIDDISPSIRLEMKDEELISTINRLVSEAEGKRNQILKNGERNAKYWKAEHYDPTKMDDWRAKIVDNRIFLSMETIIPIMTSRTPEPTIRLKDGELRENTKQLLMNLWEVPTDDEASYSMQRILEMVGRHWMIYKLGVIKYYYDPEIDDIRSEYVHPKKIVVDDKADNIYSARFVAEYCETTIDELIAQFPKKKTELKKLVGTNQGLSKITYLEFWTNEYVCYKYQNIILDKKKNPNWDYGDMNMEGTPKFNLLKKPRKPYLVLNVFNLGDGIYDDTSLLEQAKDLQDGLNKRKNQIQDNASDNGTLVGSGDYIDKKALETYSGSPREKIWLKTGDARVALHRLEPKQLAPFVFQDLQDTKAEIDNIFGAHSTTRGERGEQKTLGEAQLLRIGDMGRIDLFSRALDRLAQEWYNAMLHMYLVFKTEPLVVNSDDEDGTEIIFDRNQYISSETGKLYTIKIKVKPGSAMSIDKDSRRAEAIQLAQAQLIDPITFFERMDYANPQEMAQQLYLWQTNPVALFPELQAQQQAQQQTQMTQQLEMEANTPLEEGTPINLPEGQVIQ